MRQLSISQIKELDGGEIIPKFSGKVTKVFEQKSGEGQYGQWWLQNLIVQDAIDEITVTWGGEEPLNDLAGREVAFESSMTDKGGLQGCKRDVRVGKDGKQYEGVRLTGACKIKVIDGSEPQAEHEPIREPPVNIPATPNASKTNGKASMLDERQRAIIRQHSQSMALEVLKLKQALNELKIEDLTPAKLRSLSDYFDKDALNAATL